MKKSEWQHVYSPVPASFDTKLCTTLNNLEVLSMARQKRQSRKMMTALVAAMALMLALGCIAYAASPLIQNIFGRNVEQVEQYEALTEDEKFQKSLDDIEANMRGHAADVTVTFKGVPIAVPEFEFFPDEKGSKNGFFRSRLQYGGTPPFDPNWVDFSLRLGGNIYTQQPDDGVAMYRELHGPATTLDEMLVDGWFSNIQYDESGLLTSYIMIR